MDLLRRLARMNANLYNLGDTREGGRAVGSTLALPIGLSSRKFQPGHFPKRISACETRRVAASSRPVPKFRGRRGEAFYFPLRRGIVRTRRAPLALARARKLERVRVGQCRSGGIQNSLILLENSHFDKLIMVFESNNKPN